MLDFSFCTCAVQTCLGRSRAGILGWVLLSVALGEQNPPDPHDAPHPWIASAPPAVARLIDRGAVRIVTDDARLRATGKQGLTFFRFRVDYRYRYELTGSQPTAEDPSRVQSDLVARIRLVKLEGDHEVVLPSTYQPSKPWEAPLLLHEFDHVSISTDPRLRKIAEQVLGKPVRCMVRWDRAQGLLPETVDAAIKEEISARISELERIVQSNYQLLDRDTRDGQSNLRERFAFFRNLYSIAWLNQCEFRYLDSVSSLPQDRANKEVLEHYLSVESP